MVSTSSFAQTKKNHLLDVYKVNFGYYIKATEIGTNNPSVVPMRMAQKRKELADWKPLAVYVHPEYLYAEDILPDGEKTIWLVHYKTRRLMELQSKTAYPMNFDGILGTDVFGPEESVGNRSTGYGKLVFSNDTMTLAGYLCKQAIIRYWTKAGCADTKEGESTIWYCLELPLFYLPDYEYLQKIPSMALLIWDHFDKGIEAKTVVKQQKPLSFFDVPKEAKIL